MDSSSLYSVLAKRDAIHTNEVTQCVIWDGELDRKHRPVVDLGSGNIQVRNWIFTMLGNALPKGHEVKTKCENNRCVLEQHFELEAGEAAEGVDYTEEELEQVKQLTTEGFRQDHIAARLGTSRSRVARMVKLLKERSA